MIRYGFLGSSLVRSSINRDTLVQRQSRALSPVSRNSIQPRDSAGDGFRSFIAPNKTLLRPQRCAWKFVEPLLSFILFSRGDRISRTTEFFLPRLRSVFLRSTRKGTRRCTGRSSAAISYEGKKKKKNVADDQRDGQSSLGQRSRATSNVRSRFLFHSFLSPIPHTFAPRLLFLSPFPLLSSRTRAHLVKSRRFGYTDIRPNNTDSTTTAQSKIGPM